MLSPESPSLLFLTTGSEKDHHSLQSQNVGYCATIVAVANIHDLVSLCLDQTIQEMNDCGAVALMIIDLEKGERISYLLFKKSIF